VITFIIMNMLDYARLMSRYNRWMNEKLYDVCDLLDDEMRREDRGAPFTSIHGTLNHLLLTDRVWMGRFTGVPCSFQSLDQELYADWNALRRERRCTDDDIEQWVELLTEESFDEVLHFRSMSAKRDMSLPGSVCIVHFFNHQTHHRGQLTTLLEQCGVDFGVTDLAAMPALLHKIKLSDHFRKGGERCPSKQKTENSR
jgi:uncharacterized damage-inducible protein DinB